MASKNTRMLDAAPMAATVETPAIDMLNMDILSVALTFAGIEGESISLSVQAQVSNAVPSGAGDFEPPDASFVDYGEPTGVTQNGLAMIRMESPLAARWGRLRITGGAANNGTVSADAFARSFGG